nr:exonuclease 1 [Hymenolepis microstoma]
MGVTGLLPFLKKCSRQVNIKEFEGYTVAVDAYCWIHRASYSCAMDLALGNPTTQYVTYCMKYLKMIIESGIRPILVFDGANLPAKAETDSKRQKSKKIYKEKAAQYLLEGNRRAAHECFERCVEVTQNMASNVIKAARELGVDCIVAPYESDAQLAYLVQAGYADLVITEDSDLLLFGCKQVLFKLDMSGNGCLITWSAGIGEQCCGIPSQDFAPTHLRFLGILSGCDYFPGIPRIGLATAAKILRQCRTTDFRYLLSNMGSFCNLADAACHPIGYLQGEFLSQSSGDQISLSPSSSLSTESSTPPTSLMRKNSSAGRQKSLSGNKLHEDTIRAAMRAERTFRLQVVFDPKSRKRIRLSEPTMEDVNEERLIRADADQSESDLFIYAGDESVEADLAFAIALGNADFDTGSTINCFNPDEFKVKKLFNGLRVHSEPNLDLSPCSVGSVLKRVRRPDGERLNMSIWNASYKLEPVWLYYTDNGLQSRPFCISIEDGSGENLSDSQHIVLLNSKGGRARSTSTLPPPPSFPPSRPRLSSSSTTLSRSHRMTVSTVLTAEPSVILTNRKRPLEDNLALYTSNVEDVVASYISEGEVLSSPPKTPTRDFASSETPVISAGAYFATPVSAILQPGANKGLKGEVLEYKRPRSVFEADLSRPATCKKFHAFTASTRTEKIPPLSERRSNFSTCQVNKTGASPLSQRFSFPSLKASTYSNKAISDESSKPQTEVKDCIENERPTSPVFDESNLEPVIRSTSPLQNRTRTESSLSSFFSKFQFNPSSKRHTTL